MNSKNFFKVLFAIVFFMQYSFNSYAADYSEGSTGNADFPNLIVVTTTAVDNSSITAASAKDGSLRWAILKANTNTNGTYIKFSTTGTILLTSALPFISKKIFIDGTTQGGYSYNNGPLITIDGAYNISEGISFVSGSNYSILKGIRIKRFTFAGIMTRNVTDFGVFDNVIIDIASNNSTYNGASAIFLTQTSGSNSKFFGNIIGSDIANGVTFVSGMYMQYGIYIQVATDNTTVTGIEVGNYGNRPNIFSNLRNNAVALDVNKNQGENLTQVLIVNNIYRNNLFLTYASFEPIKLNNYQNSDPNYCANNCKAPPSNFQISLNAISGTSTPFDKIELYRANDVKAEPIELVGIAVTNEQGQWILPKNQWLNQNLNVANTWFTASATDVFKNTSIFVKYFSVCPNVEIGNIPNYVCSNGYNISLSGTPYPGSFTFSAGVGLTGSNLNPSIVPEGKYILTYTTTSNIPDYCPASVSKEIIILPKSREIKDVISISAQTFTDTWPGNPSGSSIDLSKSEFVSGMKGIWRPEESYAYFAQRYPTFDVALDAAVNLSTDGDMDNVSVFNWRNGNFAGCVPAWKRVNTVTKYSPFGFELENKDILNLNSSAIYGHSGKLVTAVASNTSSEEIGYESFEEYTGSGLNSSLNNTSNIIFYTATPATDQLNKFYKDYTVLEASNNKVTIDLPYNEAGILTGKTVTAYGGDVISYNLKSVLGDATVSSIAQGANASQTVLTLDASTFVYSGIWKGKIALTISLPYTPILTGASACTFITNRGHTGKKCIRVNGNVSIEQTKLALKSGKKYVLSAWVSSDNYNTEFTFKYPNQGRAIGLDFYSENGTLVGSSDFFEPSGNVIEGWQKIDGSFTMPAGASRVVLRVINATGQFTYIDDIRIFRFEGNMTSYVYDPKTYKVSAALDQNNFATLYYYNEQGNLFLTKKETEEGIKTITESFSHLKERP